MTEHCSPARTPPPRMPGLLAVLAGLCLTAGTTRAEDVKKDGPAGTVLSDAGSVLARQGGPGKPWQPLTRGGSIPAEAMLVGLPDSAIESKNKAVRVALLPDLDEVSPFPVVETAVVLHNSAAFDLDFTLDRGRVDVTNEKAKGAAKVRVRFRDRYWDLNLTEPGTRVALEIYGRWPPGSRFDPDPKSNKGPLTNLVLLVLKGHVDRSCPVCQIALSAPPGPALFQWDSENGQDSCAHRLDKLPEWATATGAHTQRAKKAREMLAKFQKTVVNDSLDAALKQLVNADGAQERRAGLMAAAALDKLEYVADTLIHSKRPDDWHNAVVALRHWLGRGPGQDNILYERLMKLRGYQPAEARTTVQLLHGFTEVQAARPELYVALIDLVRHERLAIRGLAHWHLQRLAPGVQVEFNPASEKEEWERAHKAWKEKIPTGQLPPRPKATAEK